MEYKEHEEDCVCNGCLVMEDLLDLLEDHFQRQTPEVQTRILVNRKKLMEELRQREHPN